MRPDRSAKFVAQSLRRGECNGDRKIRLAIVNKAVSIIAAMAIALAPTLTQAQQLPTGGSVAAGSATINAPNSSTLNVNQSSDRAVINWSSFSIGQGGTVNFNQPSSSSATLNRVTGSTPSSIAGTINAPGTVLLVNPNGIAITKSGVVNVGSFAASSLDIKDSDFMAGNYKFSGNGASAAVTNAGRINVSDGGFAALLGGQVANDGVISARLGRVGLGSGELITLDLAGDGFLSVAVPTSSLGGIVGSDGHPLVSNKGKIVADGGMVYLSAATAAGLLRDAVNVPGSIRANSVGTSNGKIVIGGGAGGKVKIAGKLKANGGKTAKGGSISVSGAQVAVSGKVSAKGTSGGTVKLTASDKVDVSGTVAATGTTGSGGVVIVTADQVTLGDTAKLDASGATGGTLLIGGDYQGGNGATKFAIEPIQNAVTTTVAAGATLTANGTAGDGGKIVVWSDDFTTFAGAISATGAGSGQGGFAEVSGHRLLDFTGTVDLRAEAGAAGTLLLDPRNVTISSGTGAGGSISSGTYTPSADNSILNVTTLQNALASGNVIVTTGSTGSQAGDITVADAVTWSSHTLTLDAYHSININATVSATGTAGLTLKTNDGGSLGFNGGNVTFASTSQALSIDGVSYTLLNSMSGVQNINNNLSGNYALTGSLDASATSGWVPIGTDGVGTVSNSGNGFTGRFNGLGNTISNLTISRPSVQDVGLFGHISGSASLSSLALTNVNVSGSDHTGALVGYATGGSVTGVSVTGTVSGAYQTGGLGGWVEATVTGSSAAVTVTSSNDDVGGLIGLARADVSQSYATGSVSGAFVVGGLLGRLSPSGASVVTAKQSFATGAVTAGSAAAGGLIGMVDSNTSISQSYATGSVQASGSQVGGLVGYVAGALTIDQSYATGYVKGASLKGGLVGNATITPTVTASYWDTTTTGQSSAVNTGSLSGATGVTTTALQAGLPSGFDSSVWGIVAGKSYPFFLWQYPAAGGAPQVIAGAAYSDLGTTAAAGATVSGLVNGTSVGSTTAGANGYFNLLFAPNTITANSEIAVYTTGATAGMRYHQNISDSVIGQNIAGTYLYETTSVATTMSAISSGLAAAIGSSGVSTTFANRYLDLNGQNFSVDQAITQSGILRLIGAGNVTQVAGAAINASSLILSSSGTSVTLTDSGNQFAALPSAYVGSGSLSLYDSVSLSLGSVTANSGMTIRSAGALSLTGTLSSSAAGNAIVLVDGTTFTSSGGGVSLTGGGRFLIYSQDSANDNIGGLTGGKIYSSTYAANPPASISASGNQFIYASAQPFILLTYSVGNSSSTYGTLASSGSVTLSGSPAGVTAVVSYYDSNNNLITLSALTAAGTYTEKVTGLSGANAGQYQIASSGNTVGTLIIGKAALTVSANNQTKSYGTAVTFAGTEFTKSGTLYGTDSISSVTLTSSGASATANASGLPYAITASNAQGSGLSNYNITYFDGGMIVNPKALTITASNTSKVYGSTLASSGSTGFTTSGLVNSDSIATVNFSSAGAAATASTNVYQLNVSGATGTGVSNYSITYNPGTLTVTQAPLTVTATNQSKTYGTAYNLGSTAFTVTGTLYNSDAITGATLTSGATAATAAAGYQTLYISNATGTGVSNYNITYVSARLTVNAAPLTITANNQSKTYGTNLGLGTTGYTVTSGTLYNGDTVTGVTLASTGANASATVAGGPYAINASNAQGSALYNYTITYVPGSLTVNPATLTVTANNASKTYNGVAFTGGNGVSYSGLVNGETSAVLGGTLAYGGTAQSSKDAGVYSITASGLTSSNYSISYQPGTLTVGQAALTVTANSQNKTYGTAIIFAGTEFTTTGTLYGSDSIASVTLTGAGAAATANAAGVPYTIVASNAQGTGASNYAITYVNGSMMVFPKALTITADNTSKVYGTTLASAATSGFTASGLVNSDSVTSVNFSSSGLASTASVGVYQLNAGGAAGAGLSNYSINYTPGQLTVTAAPLTVTANNQSKTYGSTYNLGSTDISVTGTLYNSDVITGATLTSGATSATAAAGFQTLYVSNATGTGISNYNITYVAGRLTVNQAPLTITANDASKTYGVNLGLGSTAYTSTGTLYNGDTLTGVTLTSAGAGAGAAVTGSPYVITASAAQGNGLYNYAITYVNGALTVNPAALTITANNASKTYNGVAFSGGNGVSYSGFVNGQDATALGGTLSYGGTAQNNKDAGTYSITASGQTSSNYAITYQPGVLTIGQANLTVTASNSLTKHYGDAYTFAGTEFSTAGPLYGTDSISSVTLSSAGAGATANAAGVPYTVIASNAQGTGVSNYNITYVAGGLMVNPRALTVTADNTSKQYGTVLPSLGTSGFTTSGLVNSDSVTSVNFSSGGLAGTAPVSVYQLNAGGAAGSGLSNYSITYNPGTLIVTPAPLTVTATNQSKIYGTAYDLGSTAFTTSGTFYNGDSISGVTLTSGAAAATAAAGGQTIYASNATGTGVSNYSITYNNATLTVNQAQLTITANDRSKTYGDTLSLGGTAFTYTGTLYNTDTLTSVTLSSTGAGPGASVAGGPYTITPSGAQGSGLYNYVITYVNGALTVNPATLTVTANNASKTYDGLAYSGGNGVTYSGFVNGQTSSVLSGTLAYGGTAQGATNAGGYTLTASGLTAANYTIAYTAGALTVNKAALTVKANDAGKTYGTTLNFAGNEFTTQGLVAGDTVGSVTLASAGAASGANAGQYAITASNAVGSGLSNYTISYVSGTLNVNAALLLVVTANDATKTYGATLNLGGTAFSAQGLTNGDTVTSVTLASAGAASNANAGQYAITASNAVGSGLSNYNITYVPGTLTVNPAPLTVAAANASKTYDGLAYSGGNGVTYSGFANGETASVLGGTLSYGGSAQGAKDAGSYTLTASGLTSSNYTIAYNPASLTIDKASLTVTANAATKTYDGLAYSGGNGVSYSGLVNGETPAVLGGALSYGGAAQGAKDAGSYTLTASGLTSSNYTLSYADGTLNVGKASLSVTANGAAKTYDGLAYSGGNGVTYSGFVNGETTAVLGGTVSYGGTAQGAKDAGSYTLTASGLSAANYTIAYNAGSLNVGKAALTVTATDAGKTYDGLAYAGGNGVSYSGLVNGETASVLGGTLAYGGTAQGATNAGSYTLTASGLSAANYTIAYNAGSLNVGKAALTVTATDAGKTYDGLAYSGGNGVIYSGLVNGESASVLGGALSYGGSAQGATNAGSYTLTASGLTSGNYTIAYNAGSLSVGKAALGVTVNDAAKTYDGVAYTGGNGVTYSGFVNGETASVLGGTLVYGGAAQGAINAGGYGLTASGLSANNYTIAYQSGTLTVGKATISAIANANDKVYDGTTAATGSIAGFVGVVAGDIVNIGGSPTFAFVDKNVGTGKVVDVSGLSLGGASAGNYILSSTATSTASIAPAMLTIASNGTVAAAKVYDGTTGAAVTGNGTLSGAFGGDVVTLTLDSTTYADANVGAAKTVTGSYSLGGAASGNYQLASSGFVGTAAITAATLTIASNGSVAASKVYDGTTTAAVTGNGSLAGVIGSDVVTLTLGSTNYSDANVGTAKTIAGSYGLGGASASNYQLASSSFSGTADITARPITVAADAQSKYTGAADPLFTYQMTSGTLAGADTLAGALTRTPGESVGVYGILQGTLAASANYSLTYIGANLSINDAPPSGGNGGYATSQYEAPRGGGTSPVVNVSYQPGGSNTPPVINVVRGFPTGAANNTNSGGNTVAAVAATPDASQNIEPGSGPTSLFWPISQFDKTQYSSTDLPAYAAQTSQATVLAMIARAESNNRQEPKIDQLWKDDTSGWANLNGTASKSVKFGDGNGNARTPAGDNGFAFDNGTTDIAALLKQGPVMLGGTKSPDAVSSLWFLALEFTAGGTGILANDPITGQRVILSYDTSTKKIGGVTGIFDPKTKTLVSVGGTAPDLGAGSNIPASAWNQIKSFQPSSFFAVSM